MVKNLLKEQNSKYRFQISISNKLKKKKNIWKKLFVMKLNETEQTVKNKRILWCL